MQHIIIIEEFQSIKFPEESPREIKDELPPYNGFGSEEDSLSSHYNLIPKPPRKDHVKYMEKDRYCNINRYSKLILFIIRCGLNSNILRFIAHLKTKKGINSDRKFIVSYYLCDDTIAVFEPPVRNSGFYIFYWYHTYLLDRYYRRNVLAKRKDCKT